MRSGTSLEQVLRTKLLDSPIFKTKISWECRKAKTRNTRNDCEWRKASGLFCQLIPQAAPKLAKIGDLESAVINLLDTMDTTESSAMLAGLQVASEAAAGVARGAAGGNEELEDMYKRLTSSQAFTQKISETCRGLKVQ